MNKASACLKKIYIHAAMLVMAVTAVLLFGSLSAQAERGETLRVGYSVSGSMLRREEDGSYTGYNALYLYEIARFTGWKYEFVPFTSWNDAIKALEKGDIDILPTVVKTPEREKTMLFPDEKMGSTMMSVIENKLKSRYSYGETKALEGARVGVRRNTADEREFQQWMEKSGIKCTLVEYENRDLLLKALEAGEIDFAATSYVGTVREYPALFEFATEDMYFAVTPSRRDVMLELDRTIANIERYDDPFDETLLTELDDYNEGQLKFSTEEQVFISSHKPIRVSLSDEGAPYSYWENGEAKGAVPMLLKRIEERTGLKFIFVEVPNRERELELLKNGEIDMIGNLGTNLYYAQKHGLQLTTPYGIAPLSGIVKAGREVRSVGISEANLEQIRHHKIAEGKEIKIYPGLKELMEALRSGEADIVFCNSDKASYYLNYIYRHGYTAFTLPKSVSNQGFALRAHEDPRLCRILDRVINDTAPSEFPPMLREAHEQAPMTVSSFLDRLTGRQLSVLGFVLVLVCAGSIALAYFARRNQQIEKRVAYIERERLQAQEHLGFERKLSQAQFDFYSYVDANLRKPIADIYSYTRHEGGENPDSPLYQVYQKSCEAVTLFNRIRLFNHLSARNKKLNWQATDPHNLLEHIERITDWSKDEPPIQLLWDINVAPVSLLMERSLFSMVVLQVFDNMRLRMTEGGSMHIDCSMSDVYGGRVVLRLLLGTSAFTVPARELEAMHQLMQLTQSEGRSVYEAFSNEESFTLQHQALLRASIIQLALQSLGGEWNIESGSEGTRVELEFYLDRAE